MLGNLRDKFASVHQDLTESLENYRKAIAISPEAKETIRAKLGVTHRKNPSVSVNAGADLLHRYQCQWHQLHKNNEDNALVANKIGKAIEQLDNESQRQHTAMAELLTHLGSSKQMNHYIETIEKEMVSIQSRFAMLEDYLTVLEDAKEGEDFDRLKIDHQFQLAVYKEKKASDFETVKVKLAMDHSKKVQDYERSQQVILKERQEAFQAAFEEEMNAYKTKGKIERKMTSEDGETTQVQTQTKIEEVVVEPDPDEEEALAKFLESNEIN